MGDYVATHEASATATHAIDRHRHILTDYTHEFNKATANLRSVRDRRDLLGSVQRDISYACWIMTSSPLTARRAYKSSQDQYLKENEHITKYVGPCMHCSRVMCLWQCEPHDGRGH